MRYLRGSTEKRRCRNKGDKGFTLVELIVVIVILAILAAILIPGLLKWIDKAQAKKYEAEARNIYMAAEASFVQGYVWGFEGSDNSNIIGNREGYYTIREDGGNKNWLAYIKEMSGIESITWIRIYIKDGSIKAINIDYVSPADNRQVKAYMKETGYTNSDTDFQNWFGSGKGDDGLWHFYDRGKGQPIS